MTTTSKRVMEGPLSKWTNVVNGWQYRWFVLDQNAGLLSYYTSKDKMKRGSRRGCFRLKRAIIGIDDEDECTFTIRVESRTYHFQAQNFEERERWVHALDSCIKRLHQPIRHLELTLPESRTGVTLDQRMAETEAYYQLLHEQVQSLSQSLSATEEASQIRQTAKTMLEALRQCIDTMKDSLLMDSSEVGSSEPTPPPIDHAEEGITPMASGEVDNEETKAGRERSYSTDSSGESSGSSSNSSSDGASDDEYFDAEGGFKNEPLSSEVLMSPSVSVHPAEADPSDVEEEGQEKETNDVSDGVAANRSIIMHMISQVRVGMDLTKIVLPTFILEKRSLLEMYADFLAHPDIFATIPDNDNPKDRIIAIVRYYLSAFHAARKGAVAKKPYNPILGETFHCYWDLPDARRTPPDENAKKLLESGPVPYASYDSVTFVAEQVSHHPPISSFYAECLSKRMCLTAYIWTKSRFLGLSLGVHHIGKVHLNLLDYGEEYTVTLPNAYARSILTYPWMEMGGKCHLECAQTGYYADIDFHCKPFYGGKKHRVTANLCHVTDKRPFLKVEGEWNGVMYSKHPNGDQEVFVDTLNTPTIRKKLKKLSSQDPGESRQRWQHVTEALRKQDIEAATEAKHALEEQQRADARERQRLGVEWKQKLFHKEGDAWIYNEILPKRLSDLGVH